MRIWIRPVRMPSTVIIRTIETGVTPCATSWGLRSRGAHLDDALARLRDVRVFFAELAIRENLDVVLALGRFHDVLGKKLHADGFGLAIGLHAGDFDDDLVGGKGGNSGGAEHRERRE